MTIPEEIHIHIKNLAHPKKAIRRNAENELRRLGDVTLPALMECFEQERKFSLARNVFFNQMAQGLTIVAACGFAVGMFSFYAFRNVRVFGISMALPLLLIVLIACLSGYDKLSSRRLGTVYQLLMKMDKPEIIKTLLERYTLEQMWLNPEALALLEKQIPHITLSYWNTLTPNQRGAFYCVVEQQGVTDRKKSQKFALKGLQALERVGASEAIPTVRKSVKYGMSKSLRTAAEKCLSFLETRRGE